MKNQKKRAAALFLAFGLVLGSAANVLAEAAADQAGELTVTWNLEEIYPDREAWQADYDRVMEMIVQHEDFAGTLNTAENIYKYFEFAYMGELTQLQNKLSLYAQLGYNLDPTDSVYRNMLSLLDAMSAQEQELMAFADPEIYSLPLETREEIFSDPLFDGMEYAFQKYTDPDAEPLGEEANWVLAVKSMGDGYAYTTFEILNSVELANPVITMPDGTEAELTNELYTDIVYSDEYDEAFKAEANQLVLTKPKTLVNTFASLLEENAVQAYTSALISNCETTREAALKQYDVDPAVYDMLIEAAHEGAADYQRYLKAHARGLGLEVQMPYHMGDYVSAFYPGKTEYEDAVAEVEEALGVLGEEYIEMFRNIMESGHVDVYPSDTKTTGAFEMQYGEEYLPWLLFNYNGYSDDVSTIAHEMGHAVYDAFASENQMSLYGSPTIFTQEVASTTNELLYYSYKMNQAADDEERLYYLENLLSMFGGTFFIQMLYAEFEDSMYQTVESGLSLDAEELSDKWIELYEQYRGDAIKMYPDFRYQWATVPHFYYVYYVYQYASSVAYASSIAERISTGEEGAVEDYLSFLKLGGSAAPEELLSAAGVDPLEKETYDAALRYFSDLVDEYERLVDAKSE